MGSTKEKKEKKLKKSSSSSSEDKKSKKNKKNKKDSSTGGDEKKKKSKKKQGNNKDEKKEKKKKKNKNDKEKDNNENAVEDLLEAPPKQGIVANFLERYCCCRSAAKIAYENRQREERERKEKEEEEARLAEEKEKELKVGDIPIRELRKYIREFTKEYEAEFWPSLFDREVEKRVKFTAATRIQSMIRKWLGPIRRRRKELEALSEYELFWEKKRQEKLNEKDLKRIEVETRTSFSSMYAKKYLNAMITKKAQRDAAYLIQRAWRGYVGRCIFKYFFFLAQELRLKKEKPPKSRFGSETFRRVWGRKKFVPAKGWPGKADYIEFDMWKYKDKPPKGNDFGLLTRKIHAAPKSELERQLLMEDKNSWVGIPISVIPSEEAKKEEPVGVQTLKARSPYKASVVRKQSASEAPKRLSGLQMLKSLGWRNPTTDKNADAKAKSHLVGLAGEKGSGTYLQQKQDRENSPVNRHRIKQKAEEEIHPRHRAIEEVLRIPPDVEANSNDTNNNFHNNHSSTAYGESGGPRVDLNSKVFQESDSFVPYYHSSATMGHSSHLDSTAQGNSLDREDTNDGIHRLSSFGNTSALASTSLLQEKIKPDAPRLSTLRHDEIVPVERGARKAPMGRPLRLGGATHDLALGRRSVSQVAREVEKNLLQHDSQEPVGCLGSPQPHGLITATSSRWTKSVSFADNEANPLEASRSHGGTMSSNQDLTSDNEGSAWQRIRDDVSTLTGSRKWREMTMNSAYSSTSNYDNIGKKRKKSRFSSEQRKKMLESRERPWPMKSRPLLQLEYSWVPQPLLERAAQSLYAEDPSVLEERRRVEAERVRAEKALYRQPPLSRLSQYNDDDPTVISNLTTLDKFRTKTALSIRDERCRQKAMKHPYHWL